MSKRATYWAGGAAVVVGIAMIVIALVVLSGDDSGESAGTATQSPPTGATGATRTPPAEQAPKPSGGTGAGGKVATGLEQSGKAKAPPFELAVVQQGSPPSPVREKLDRASGGGSLGPGELAGTPIVLYMPSSKCGPCRADARL